MSYGQRYRHWTYVNYNYLIQNLDSVCKEIREVLISLSEERESPCLQHANVRGQVYELVRPSPAAFEITNHPKLQRLFLKHTQGLSPEDFEAGSMVNTIPNPILAILAVAENTFSQLHSYMMANNHRRFVNEFESVHHQTFIVRTLQNAVANIEDQFINNFVGEAENFSLTIHVAAPAFRFEDDKIAEFHVMFFAGEEIYLMKNVNNYVEFNSVAVRHGSFTVDTPTLAQ
jgi:hypothetical protein